MIIAASLFLAALAIGLRFRPVVIVTFALLVSGTLVAIWSAYDELEWFKLLVWFAFMTAIQAGYLLGTYIAVSAGGGHD